MTHAKGANLGGITCLADIRNRCVIEAGCECWLIRTARGRAMPTDKRIVVWAHGRGCVTASRLAWEYHVGRAPQRQHVVYRVCDSYDFVNPAHLRCGPKASEGKHTAATGKWRTVERAKNGRAAGQTRAKLTPEQVAWARDCGLPVEKTGAALGISASRISAIRAGKAYSPLIASSVFSWRPA